MPSPRSATKVLEEEFLVLRCKLLELAAGLDRLEQADGDASTDPRFEQLKQGLKRLQQPGTERAKELQMLFSRPYQPEWASEMGVQLGKQEA